jgi:glycerophosphoryl diester phosphodiesterase
LKSDHHGECYSNIVAEVMTLLRATGLAGRATITSFDPQYLDEAHHAGARDLIWLLKENSAAELAAGPAEFAHQTRLRGITEVAIRGRDTTPNLVATCRENNLVLGAFAAKDMDFERLLRIGLSVFTTDRPDLALAAKASSSEP